MRRLDLEADALSRAQTAERDARPRPESALPSAGDLDESGFEDDAAVYGPDVAHTLLEPSRRPDGGHGDDPERGRRAMQSVLVRLVKPHDRLSLLFTPPFNKTTRDPGYVKGYPPGTRENGGQYTHAATWTVWAYARLGDGEQAAALFDLLNPIFHSDSEEKAAVYRVEPYVICADVYSQAPFIRRGGWTWYTGSAAWMYCLGLEAILGFKKIGDKLYIDPVIPPDWDGFEIRYQFGDSEYLIHVDNPEHVSKNIRQIILDGNSLNELSIPLVDDHLEHRVVVTMGNSGE